MENPSRLSLQEAYVLHRRAFRESSLLLDIFTREHGMLRLIAKGASRGKAAKSISLQPFLCLQVSWAGRSQLPVLTDCEVLIRHALKARPMLCGLYLNELLLRLLAACDPHPRLYESYQQALVELAEAGDIEQVLRYFELSLLQGLGYAPRLDRDAESGEPVARHLAYVFVHEHGPVRCEPHPGAVKGSTLLGLCDRRLESVEDAKAAKRLMRSLINQVLGSRPLKSRELFQYSTFELLA